MKKKSISALAGILILSGIIVSPVCFSQNQDAVVKKYMTQLPAGKPDEEGIPGKYRMTTNYTNLDLYGNFTGKARVTGDYTRGLGDGRVSWNNVFIAESKIASELFNEGVKQSYMEDMTYIPSPEMLDETAFKDFPAGAENILARNLIWDMMTIETFAWDYSDSLKLNRSYVLPEIDGEFNIAEIGTYEHAGIQLCWTGVSLMNDEMCAVIEYRALSNKLKIEMDQINTRGTEQYWGTTWISLKTRQVEYAEMYGGTIQEIEVKGIKEKFIVKTIRELWVERIY